MNEEEKKSSPKIRLFPIFLFLISFVFFEHLLSRGNTLQLGTKELKEILSSEKVEDVKIRGSKIYGSLKEKVNGKSRFESIIPSKEVSDEIAPFALNFKVEEEKSAFGELIILLLPTLLFFSLWYFFFKGSISRIGNPTNLMGIGKSTAKVHSEISPQVTFKDVAGADEALQELQEVIYFLQNKEKIKVLGGKMPKGILLVGAPGTGKTLIAKAMAGEAQVPFFSCSGSEFVEMFVGVGAARVRDLFNRARASSPCVIFVDELDALGKMRQITNLSGNDEKEQTLNQLLVEMDGFDTKEGIIILAATNRPEMIDPALLRSGRFDKQIIVDRPDKKGREDILKIHLKKTKFDPQLDVKKISSLTPGFTGADLANLVNEAALMATRRNAPLIAEMDFTLALERVVAGVEKKNRLMSPEEKVMIATHELGHAMIAHYFSKDDKIHKVSIIPHGIGSMGHTIQRPTDDKYLFTKKDLKNKLLSLLGGRAAELVFFHGPSTGASDDLAKATALASDMITKFGMSETLGTVSFEKQTLSYLENRPQLGLKISEETLSQIDQEIRTFLNEAEEKAIHFISFNQDILIKAREILLQKESLTEEEVSFLFKSLKEEQIREERFLS